MVVKIFWQQFFRLVHFPHKDVIEYLKNESKHYGDAWFYCCILLNFHILLINLLSFHDVSMFNVSIVGNLKL